MSGLPEVSHRTAPAARPHGAVAAGADPADPGSGSPEPDATLAPNGSSGAHTAVRDLPFQRSHLLLLAAITCLAAWLRLHRLGEWSFWIDEAHTYRDVMMPWDQFWSSSHVRVYPLSSLLLRGMSTLFPADSEGWLRLPYVFFGIASVPTLALVGRPLVGRRAALVAALLLALAPWHVYWSQNCRAYAIVLFFVMIAAGAFFHGLQQRSPLAHVVALLATLAAGLSHPSAYLILGVFAGHLLLVRAGRRRAGRGERRALERWMPLLLLGLLGAVLLLLLPLLQFFQRSKPVFSFAHLLHTTVWFVRVPMLVLAIGGVLWLFQRGERVGTFLLSWCFLPLVVLAVMASGVVPALATRVTAQYAFYTLPAFCLLAAVAVVALLERWEGAGLRRGVLRAMPIAILLLDMGAYDYLYFTQQHGDRPQWREAAEYVRRQAGGKRVLTSNEPSMKFYLDPGRFWGEAQPGDPEIVALGKWALKDGAAFWEAHVQEARAQGQNVWVVVTQPELDEMDRGFGSDEWLRRNMLQVKRFANWTGPKDMTVLVYELPPAVAPRSAPSSASVPR